MEEDRSAKFSPSKLSVYENCPRRYQYRYVDRIARDRKTPETVLGVAVHSALEELHERAAGGQSPSAVEAAGWFDAAFDEGWDGSVLARDARFSKDDWRRVGRECVAAYHAAHAPFTATRTVAVERRVGFPLEAAGGTWRIEGFVDRLALAPDGAFEVHDYKTSKHLPSQAEVDADRQLALYELAIRHEWPDAREVRLVWHYLRHGKTLVSVRDAAARERLREETADLVAAIKRDHAFAPKRTALCDWCEYKDLCPEFAHPEKVAALPPADRGADAGVRLADAFAAVEERRRRLREDLKAADREREELESRLADWAEEAGVTVVAGTDADVAVSIKPEIHLPTKTSEPERHAALEEEARRSPLWEHVARLDAHALLEGVKARRWAGPIMALAESLVERYGARAVSRAARLRRRRGADED